DNKLNGNQHWRDPYYSFAPTALSLASTFFSSVPRRLVNSALTPSEPPLSNATRIASSISQRRFISISVPDNWRRILSTMSITRPHETDHFFKRHLHNAIASDLPGACQLSRNKDPTQAKKERLHRITSD